MDNELQQAINALGTEHKSAILGLKEKYDQLQAQHSAIQKQLDAIDADRQGRIGGPPSEDGATAGLKAIGKMLKENKEALDRHGRLRFEVPTLLPEGKSTILSTNLTSTEPAAGIQGAGRFPYRLRTLFRTVPTTLPTIGVLRTTAENLLVSPQTEGQAKAESSLSFALAQIPVQTLATFVTFSRQAMDDIDGFQAFLNSTLIWALERDAESQILAGDGTGTNLPGLITGATAFDTTILDSAYNRVDVLGAAAVQLQEAGYSPDFAVVSPRNWFRMVSLKDSVGQYVLTNPRTTVGQQVYQLTVLPSDRMIGDAFLVGDSSQSVIRQKMQSTIEISFEHGTNFTSNLATALAEERFGIQTSRPDAYVHGTLASSPA